MSDKTSTAVVPSFTRLGKPDWTVLMPELPGYFTPGPADPPDYAFGSSNFQVALGFSDLFWPPFVLVDDMVFRGLPELRADGDGLAYWLEKFEGDKSKVEQMLNHEHLIDLFRLRYRPADNAQIGYLAVVVQDMWAAKLARDFPERKFAVELYRDGEEPCDWVLTFFQQR